MNFAQASRRRWKAAIAAPIKKNVPRDMIDEYLSLGWKLLSTQQNYATVVWTKAENPP